MVRNVGQKIWRCLLSSLNTLDTPKAPVRQRTDLLNDQSWTNKDKHLYDLLLKRLWYFCGFLLKYLTPLECFYSYISIFIMVYLIYMHHLYSLVSLSYVVLMPFHIVSLKSSINKKPNSSNCAYTNFCICVSVCRLFIIMLYEILYAKLLLHTVCKESDLSESKNIVLKYDFDKS